MKYYIKGENGKYAEANFEIRRWNGSGWDPDCAHDLETNTRWWSVLTWNEYEDLVDWWKSDAGAEGYDMADMEVMSDDYDELVFCLEADDLERR